MAVPIKNTTFEKIKAAGSLTDAELYKALIKDEPVPKDRFNKILLDLEIMGLIKVSWITKDEKRIEVSIEKTEEGPRADDTDYEASFPGFNK